MSVIALFAGFKWSSNLPRKFYEIFLDAEAIALNGEIVPVLKNFKGNEECIISIFKRRYDIASAWPVFGYGVLLDRFYDIGDLNPMKIMRETDLLLPKIELVAKQFGVEEKPKILIAASPNVDLEKTLRAYSKIRMRENE